MGGTDVPRLLKIARSDLLHLGNLKWIKINPDIFGSTIQSVTDDEKRGALGMHDTSELNLLNVLNPLFLEGLPEKLEKVGDNPRKRHNPRNHMAKIRVFVPACGSGNFLVIAYRDIRVIEAEITKRRGEADRRTENLVMKFRDLDLRDRSAEIAWLARSLLTVSVT